MDTYSFQTVSCIFHTVKSQTKLQPQGWLSQVNKSGMHGHTGLGTLLQLSLFMVGKLAVGHCLYTPYSHCLKNHTIMYYTHLMAYIATFTCLVS